MNKPTWLYSLDELNSQSLIILLGCSLLIGALVISGMHRKATAQDPGLLYQMRNNGLIYAYTGKWRRDGKCPGWQLLDANPNTNSTPIRTQRGL